MVLRLERRTLTRNAQRPTLKVAEFPATTHYPCLKIPSACGRSWIVTRDRDRAERWSHNRSARNSGRI